MRGASDSFLNPLRNRSNGQRSNSFHASSSSPASPSAPSYDPLVNREGLETNSPPILSDPILKLLVSSWTNRTNNKENKRIKGDEVKSANTGNERFLSKRGDFESAAIKSVKATKSTNATKSDSQEREENRERSGEKLQKHAVAESDQSHSHRDVPEDSHTLPLQNASIDKILTSPTAHSIFNVAKPFARSSAVKEAVRTNRSAGDIQTSSSSSTQYKSNASCSNNREIVADTKDAADSKLDTMLKAVTGKCQENPFFRRIYHETLLSNKLQRTAKRRAASHTDGTVARSEILSYANSVKSSIHENNPCVNGLQGGEGASLITQFPYINSANGNTRKKSASLYRYGSKADNFLLKRRDLVMSDTESDESSEFGWNKKDLSMKAYETPTTKQHTTSADRERKRNGSPVSASIRDLLKDNEALKHTLRADSLSTTSTCRDTVQASSFASVLSQIDFHRKKLSFNKLTGTAFSPSRKNRDREKAVTLCVNPEKTADAPASSSHLAAERNVLGFQMLGATMSKDCNNKVYETRVPEFDALEVGTEQRGARNVLWEDVLSPSYSSLYSTYSRLKYGEPSVEEVSTADTAQTYVSSNREQNMVPTLLETSAMTARNIDMHKATVQSHSTSALTSSTYYRMDALGYKRTHADHSHPRMQTTDTHNDACTLSTLSKHRHPDRLSNPDIPMYAPKNHMEITNEKGIGSHLNASSETDTLEAKVCPCTPLAYFQGGGGAMPSQNTFIVNQRQREGAKDRAYFLEATLKNEGTPLFDKGVHPYLETNAANNFEDSLYATFYPTLHDRTKSVKRASSNSREYPMLPPFPATSAATEQKANCALSHHTVVPSLHSIKKGGLAATDTINYRLDSSDSQRSSYFTESNLRDLPTDTAAMNSTMNTRTSRLLNLPRTIPQSPAHVDAETKRSAMTTTEANSVASADIPFFYPRAVDPKHNFAEYDFSAKGQARIETPPNKHNIPVSLFPLTRSAEPLEIRNYGVEKSEASIDAEFEGTMKSNFNYNSEDCALQADATSTPYFPQLEASELQSPFVDGIRIADNMHGPPSKPAIDAWGASYERVCYLQPIHLKTSDPNLASFYAEPCNLRSKALLCDTPHQRSTKTQLDTTNLKADVDTIIKEEYAITSSWLHFHDQIQALCRKLKVLSYDALKYRELYAAALQELHRISKDETYKESEKLEMKAALLDLAKLSAIRYDELIIAQHRWKMAQAELAHLHDKKEANWKQLQDVFNQMKVNSENAIQLIKE